MITHSRRHKLDKYDPNRIIKKYGEIFKTARVNHEKPTFQVGYDPLLRV